MLKKIYLHILILCGISCQGIIATLSGEDTRESLDIIVRKRRVINHLPGGTNPTAFEDANYMVVIKKYRRALCVGVILSHYTVLTAASCVEDHISVYKVLSGSAYDTRCTNHSVTSKVEYHGHPPLQSFDGIALITIDFPFVFNVHTGFIRLHEGALPAGTLVTVRGWGCGYPLERGPVVKRRLRSITLPIMNHTECVNEYRNHYPITEKYICTYHAQQYCARTDAGAPLIFNNKLAGIHVWKGERHNRINPDVYIDLNRAEYRTWIREKTILM